MPHVERPDGARIYYEVEGHGFPLLLFALGGVNSEVRWWRERSPINPFTFADQFMVIGMNQRNAAESPAPFAAPSWDTFAADQIAVLDAVGVPRAHLWGGCIGVAYVLRFIQEAPERVVAAVCQNPVGYVEGLNSRATFFAMFEPTLEAARSGGMLAVVAAARTNPVFTENNQAGPFAARIDADPAFREQMLALDPAEYERVIHEYGERTWAAHVPYMSVEQSVVARCPAPLLVLPGNDEFHPTPHAERLCREAPNATCMDPEWRRPERVEETTARVRDFLREHRPAS